MSSSCKKTSPLGMILFSKDQRRSPKIGTDPATDHGFSQDFSTFLWCFFLCVFILYVFLCPSLDQPIPEMDEPNHQTGGALLASLGPWRSQTAFGLLAPFHFASRCFL